MQRPRPNERDSTIDPVSLHALLALSQGMAPVASPADWQALLSVAQRERISGLIWARSSSTIRRSAPPEVAAIWQRRALAVGLHGQHQLEQLAAAVRALRARDIRAVVLKGAPLAQLLYGDPSVRPTLDSDIYIPVEQRADAARTLLDLGWRLTSGQWPEEEKFERQMNDCDFVLEIHSSAIDDAPLGHIQIPIDDAEVQVGGYALPAQTGRYLPAYLASHLLKHHERPLLWALDFSALWNSLDESERSESRQAARKVGLMRHVEWAVRLAHDMREVAAAGPQMRRAARRVQRALGRRSELSRVAQLSALSASPLAACRVVAGRIWPSAWRQGWRDAPRYFAGRAVGWAYRHLVFELPADPANGTSSERLLSLADADCARRLSAALEESEGVWVRSIGQNMAPALPLFGAARIVGVADRELKIGDVIAIRVNEGQCTLERVVRFADESIVVKPDARLTKEHSISRDAVLGICDLVQVGGGRVPIESRPHGNLGMMQAIVRSRFAAASATLARR